VRAAAAPRACVAQQQHAHRRHAVRVLRHAALACGSSRAHARCRRCSMSACVQLPRTRSQIAHSVNVCTRQRRPGLGCQRRRGRGLCFEFCAPARAPRCDRTTVAFVSALLRAVAPVAAHAATPGGNRPAGGRRTTHGRLFCTLFVHLRRAPLYTCRATLLASSQQRSVLKLSPGSVRATACRSAPSLAQAQTVPPIYRRTHACFLQPLVAALHTASARAAAMVTSL
jgi:hypothetical protein